MRLLLAACLLVGCYREPAATTTAPPANKQRVADYSHAADDELAFVPKESEFVIGFDFAGLRESAAWRDQLEPIVGNLPSLAKIRSTCGFDPFTTLTHGIVGIRQLPVSSEATAVTAGGDARGLIGCLLKQMGSSDVATHDGDVTIMTSTNDKYALAIMPVGHSHVLAYAAPSTSATASAQVVRTELKSGSPLRDSPAFMATFDKLEHGSAMWFIVNGNAKVFRETASMGLNPRLIDGTLTVTDRYVLSMRVTMSTPADAQRLATLLRGVAANVTAMVDKLDIREDGPVLRTEVVVTQAQAVTILAAFGAMVPP